MRREQLPHLESVAITFVPDKQSEFFVVSTREIRHDQFAGRILQR